MGQIDWAIALIRCLPPPPPVQDKCNFSGVKDKSGGILRGKGQELENSLGVKPTDINPFTTTRHFSGEAKGP